MLTPSPQRSDARGKRWLHAQVQAILAANAVALAPPGAEGEPSCYWGEGPEAHTPLYFRLECELEPKALHVRRDRSAGCGSGLYSTQHNAVLSIHRMLTKMGIPSAEHARGLPIATLTISDAARRGKGPSRTSWPKGSSGQPAVPLGGGKRRPSHASYRSLGRTTEQSCKVYGS